MRFLALSLLALSGCRPADDWQPLPFQRPTLAASESSLLRGFVRMSDPDAPRHFVRDISASLEGSAWRWTEKRPALRLFVRSSDTKRVRVELAVAGDTFQQTGPVNVTFYVNDRRVGERRYTRDGQYVFEQALPAGLLQPAAVNTLAIEVDKVWVSPADGAKLGLILLGAGFLP